MLFRWLIAFLGLWFTARHSTG